MDSKLPYKSMTVIVFDFKKDKRSKHLKDIHNTHGVVHYAEDEIWINKSKATFRPVDTIQLTKYHEFVHARRQAAGEEVKGPIEEDIVELEAIARCPNNYLNQAQSVLKKYLVTQLWSKKRLSPNKLEDLKLIHRKIRSILKYKYKKQGV